MSYIIDEKGNMGKSSKPIKYIINGECWQCISHCKDGGWHPRIRRLGKRFILSRYIYFLYNGEIPEGLVVRHKCDNPKCINPIHLELGTQKDNIQDMVDRGRTTKGRSHSKETKNKMSESRKGKIPWNKGRKLSEQEKEKIKNSMIGKNRKHTIDKYIKAKQLLIEGMDTRTVSNLTGISWSSIKDFRNGKSWANIKLGGGLKEWLTIHSD